MLSERTHATALLVEDEPAVLAVAARALEHAGFHVIRARDAAEALELEERHEGPLDVLVTDVVMPGTGGAELAELLSCRRPGLPTLYISGYTDTDLVERGGPRRGSRFLAKPFSPAGLARAVRWLLDEGDRAFALA